MSNTKKREPISNNQIIKTLKNTVIKQKTKYFCDTYNLSSRSYGISPGKSLRLFKNRQHKKMRQCKHTVFL